MNIENLHRKTVSRVPRITYAGAVTLACILACSAAFTRAGTIFDDDWTPPKPVGQPYAIAAQPPPAVPPPAVPPPVAHDGKPPQAPSPVRLPVPAKADQARSRALLKAVYARQINDRSVVGRKKLARTLLDDAPKMADSPSDRFVLLVGAIKASNEAANLELSFQAADLIAAQYEVDALSVKADAVLKVSLRGDSPATMAQNVKAALDLIDPLLEADDFQTAAKVLALARPLAANDRSLAPVIQNQAQMIEAAHLVHDRLAPYFEKLKTVPDDPAANLAIGTFLCFTKGDWRRGLPMLARGSDAGLKQQAMLELSATNKPQDVMRLADEWWDISAKEPAASRYVIRQHAVSFYKTELENATGLRKALLERRIADAAAPPVVAKKNSVDLLALLDMTRGETRGSLSVKEGALIFEAGTYSHFEFPYHPPAEYDMHVRFARVKGNDGVLLIMSSHGKMFTWWMGFHDNMALGFEMIAGKGVLDNPTAVRVKPVLENGRIYETTVKVRNGSVEAFLDNQRVTGWKTDYADMSIWSGWELKDHMAVGLGSHNSTVKFLTVEIIEVSGYGEIVKNRR